MIMKKTSIIAPILVAMLIPQAAYESNTVPIEILEQSEISHPTINDSFLLATNPTSIKQTAPFRPITHTVTITAYTSEVNQTDSTPFITASGTYTREGVVAANFLPIGTAVQIPSLFGDKVFVVEDRMHPRNAHKMDIWMPSLEDAKLFGSKRAKVIVL